MWMPTNLEWISYIIFEYLWHLLMYENCFVSFSSLAYIELLWQPKSTISCHSNAMVSFNLQGVVFVQITNKVCKYWPKNRLTFEYSNWIRKILHTILLGGIKCQKLTFNVIMLNRLLWYPILLQTILMNQ